MNRSLRLSAVMLAVAAACATLPAHAAKGDKVEPAAKAAKSAPAFTVNGVAISREVVDTFLKEQLAQGVPDNDELRNAVKEELARREAVAQAARKKGLDKKPEVAARMELARQEVLIRAYIQDYMAANPITDEVLKEEYTRVTNTMNAKEYKTRHILVDNEAEAKGIIEKLGKGEKFEDLAKASKDPGSKDTGGDLGWSQPGAFVPEFAGALTALEKGKYSTTPVKSEFGYHVILLEDSRNATPPAFEQVKPQLQQHLQQQRIGKAVAALREKAVVK